MYGNVEAVPISGSTYNGTTTQSTSAKRPTMPDWTTVFNYYRTNGTEINISSLPTQPAKSRRNVSFENDDGRLDRHTGRPGMPTADVTDTNNWSRTGSMQPARQGSHRLERRRRAAHRSLRQAGSAVQRIELGFMCQA